MLLVKDYFSPAVTYDEYIKGVWIRTPQDHQFVLWTAQQESGFDENAECFINFLPVWLVYAQY